MQMKSTQKKHEMYMPNAKVLRWTQRNLYSTGLRLGFASGKMQLLGFASDKNAKNWRHPTPEIPTCWYILRWVTQNSGLPNANPRRQVFCVLLEYRLNLCESYRQQEHYLHLVDNT